MLLKRILGAASLVALLMPTGVADAGPLKYIGAKLAAGAVEKIQPALGKTLEQTDTLLTKQEGQIEHAAGSLISLTSTKASGLLDQTDRILEKQLLHVQLGADEVIDSGLDKVDGVARRRIAQIGTVLDKSIGIVTGALASDLKEADAILEDRIADVGRIVTTTLEQVDATLGARIEQLDEIAGRRLGNVDVIATKQRLGLERTIARAAWLLALIVFVLFVSISLWNEYDKAGPKIEEAAPGPERARRYVEVLGRPLLRHLTVGAVVAILLATLPQHLPMAAAKDQEALVSYHEAELGKSVDALDWTRARFHASQLELLDPSNVDEDRIVEARADLLRDVLGRPTALETPSGAGEILQRVTAVERLAAGRLDPDAATTRAMITWRRARTRREEHEAATLAARALWSSAGGFTLAPMARLIVEAYLHAPETGAVDDSSGHLAANESLAAVLAAAAPNRPGCPFEAETFLFHAMATLDDASNAAFVEMVKAQARVSRLAADQGKPSRADEDGLAAARKERNGHAAEVIAAWQTFDDELRKAPVLSNNPLVLNAFRLNDVALSHALWFVTAPETTAWPTRLADIKGAGSNARKVSLAPARVVWARRYATLLQGPARVIIELQEAQRFDVYQEDTLAFEEGFARDPSGGTQPPATPKGHETAPHELPGALQAASAAAALNLYEGSAGARQPLALELTSNLNAAIAKLRGQTTDALGDAQASTEDQLSKLDGKLDTKLDAAAKAAMTKLRSSLRARGVLLI